MQVFANSKGMTFDDGQFLSNNVPQRSVYGGFCSIIIANVSLSVILFEHLWNRVV